MAKDTEPSKYSAGEKILCFHGPLLYEAKCLDTKRREEDKEWLYLVHYQGWSKSWDEWVTDKRIYKYDQVGLKKQAELEKEIKSGRKVKTLKKTELQKVSQEMEAAVSTATSVKKEQDSPLILQHQSPSPEKKTPPPPISDNPASTKPIKSNVSSTTKSIASATTQSSNRKRKSRAESLLTDAGLLEKTPLVLDIPENIKNWIIDDWDLVSRQSMLVTLPVKPNSVSKILTDYLNTMNSIHKSELIKPPEGKVNNSSTSMQTRQECVLGLLLFFDTMLGSHLLYRFERLQYADILKQHYDKKMSTIYGVQHLLRLLVKIADFSSNFKMDQQGQQFVAIHLNEFLKFLSLNENNYFRLEDYLVASPEYQRRAMC